MKSKGFVCVAMALVGTMAVTLKICAQDAHPAQAAKHRRYKVVDLGTFGGPSSSVNCCEHQITARGAVVGSADTSAANPNPGCFNGPLGAPDCNVNHAFQWRDGTLTDLGALPGGYNSYAQALNADGTVVGSAENGAIDPDLGVAEYDAVIWRNGQITDLGTLGGNESLGLDVNNRGQIVGAAANVVPDPASFFGFATQTRPFFWEHGVMRDLDTFGSTDGAAYLMNDRGQAMGQFYVNGGAAVDPIFWDENGNAMDIGTLGGTNGNPWGLNNRGQVVGDSNLAGDTAHHGFLWDRGTLTDLGTLGGNQSIARWISDSGVITGNGDVPGSQTHHGIRWAWKQGVMTVTDLGVINNDPCSTGFAVNNSGQIVGDAGACGIGGDAWLWENGGPMVDLNTLAIPGSGMHLADARLINNRGEVVCTGVLPNGDKHAVLLIPVGDEGNSNRAVTMTPSRAAEGRVADIATQVSPVPDYTRPPIYLAVSASPLTPGAVNPGGLSTSTLKVWDTTGATNTAALSCVVQPSIPLGPTCSISPASLPINGTTTLTVTTTGPSARLLSNPSSGLFNALLLPLFGLVATGVGLGSGRKGVKRKLSTAPLACALVVGVTLQVACGSSSVSRTPPGTYTINITATAYVPEVTASASTTLTVQ